ncbi:DUF1127 domain-containing protein [Rhodobacteraceae bacterium CCMM004]|nr:DUF1127 domain-containing protein [Rhodobacteraceae bacterium CCMM004]
MPMTPSRTLGSARVGAPRSRMSLLARILGLADLQRSRARLATLDDHILNDIGLTRDDAEAEARRPLWDPPVGWRR